jgi:hypothetical protein
VFFTPETWQVTEDDLKEASEKLASSPPEALTPEQKIG